MFLSRVLDITKLKAHLANGITIMNLSFGIIAVLLLLKGYSHMSQLFIFLAAFFDRFDGMVARKLQTVSQFGKELDSLCDLVSFGIAPALLIYHSVLYQMPTAGIMITILYVVCGAIRLAKFNVKEFDGAFYGIPITAAGIVLALSSFAVDYLPVAFFVVITSILTVLMVSNIRIPKM